MSSSRLQRSFLLSASFDKDAIAKWGIQNFANMWASSQAILPYFAVFLLNGNKRKTFSSLFDLWQKENKSSDSSPVLCSDKEKYSQNLFYHT